MPGQLYVIAAPSGAGKTSLVKALMARDPGLRFSVSYTTRPRRATEVDGRDYHFVAAAEFERMIAAGEFLEHAQVFDNYYGTGLGATRAALQAGERLLLEIDWQGARQVRSKLPEAEMIFILPPSLASLEERLRTRSTDTEAVIQRRLRDSVGDLAHYREFDFVVVNDRFETAVGELAAIVAGQGAHLRADRPEIAALAGRLLG
jgi:guanylate kinase